MSRLRDWWLEVRINFAMWRVMRTQAHPDLRKVNRLLSRRSRAKVARMERRMGLN